MTQVTLYELRRQLPDTYFYNLFITVNKIARKTKNGIQYDLQI